MRYDIENNGPIPGAIPAPIQAFLKLDGTGTSEVTGDYSSTPGTFRAGPPAGEVWAIYRTLIYLEGVGQFAAAKYGPLDALDPGIPIKVYRGSTGESYDLTDGLPLKTAADISRHCFDVAYLAWGVGANSITARWTFRRGGSPIALVGDLGDRVQLVAADDFSGLGSHTFKLNGVRLVGGEGWD